MARRTNLLLKLLLVLCLLGGIAGLVAFGQGDSTGAFLFIAMMALATFPLFHFASLWPLKHGDPSAGNKPSDKDDRRS